MSNMEDLDAMHIKSSAFKKSRKPITFLLLLFTFSVVVFIFSVPDFLPKDKGSYREGILVGGPESGSLQESGKRWMLYQEPSPRPENSILPEIAKCYYFGSPQDLKISGLARNPQELKVGQMVRIYFSQEVIPDMWPLHLQNVTELQVMGEAPADAVEEAMAFHWEYCG